MSSLTAGEMSLGWRSSPDGNVDPESLARMGQQGVTQNVRT